MSDADFDTWLIEHRALGDEHFVGTTRDIHLTLADWCQENRAWPRVGLGLVANLWGFGEAPVFAEDADRAGRWFHIRDIEGPTGVPYPQLVKEAERDRADDYGDVSVLHWPGGNGLWIVRHSFAMRVFAGLSPWAKEFTANTLDLMRLGFLHSGLADSIGMGDAIRGEGVPSVEVARHQAQAGPLGDTTPEHS